MGKSFFDILNKLKGVNRSSVEVLGMLFYNVYIINANNIIFPQVFIGISSVSDWVLAVQRNLSNFPQKVTM